MALDILKKQISLYRRTVYNAWLLKTRESCRTTWYRYEVHTTLADQPGMAESDDEFGTGLSWNMVYGPNSVLWHNI